MKNTETETAGSERTSALTIVSPEKVQLLDDTATKYQNAIQVCNRPYERAFLLAEAMIKLREMLTPEMMKPIMGLKNMRLGFLTDRSGKPNWKNEVLPEYGLDVIRDCVIEAVMQGVRLIGNEFNVISGGCYITRNGFTRKLAEFPDLSALRIVLGVPIKNGESGVKVACKASWKVKGQADSLDCEIPIRIDKGSTVDNILGKVDRKFKARIYAQLTGSELGDGEVDDLPAGTKDVTGSRRLRPTSRRSRLRRSGRRPWWPVPSPGQRRRRKPSRRPPRRKRSLRRQPRSR